MAFFNLFKKKEAPNTKINSSTNSVSSWVDAQYIDDPVEKEKYLVQLTNNPETTTDLHFTYNHLLKLYYQQRDNWDNALENCIDICKKDICLYPDLLKESLEYHDYLYKDDNNKPKFTMFTIPSFQRLAIIYEKQQRYDEAILICEKAIEYGLHERTKGDFEGRLARLINKKKHLK